MVGTRMQPTDIKGQDDRGRGGRPPRSGVRARVLRFAGESRGSTAVEFAMIAPFFFLTILFIISIGYIQFMSQALDYATQKAARAIRTGNVQTASILTASTFTSQIVCPLLPSLFNCANVIVQSRNLGSLTTVTANSAYPNIYTQYMNANNTGLILPTLSNASTTFCTGSGSNFVYLQIVYPVPFFMSFLSTSTVATTYNGQPSYVIMSTATFLNEPFAAAGNC